MQPRYEPSYNAPDYPDDFFAGYVEEFDLYLNVEPDTRYPITVVGSPSPTPRTSNFIIMRIQQGDQIYEVTHAKNNIHLTPYHMCLIYAKAVEHGLIKGETNGL